MGGIPTKKPGAAHEHMNSHVLATFLCTDQVNGVHVFAWGLVLLSERRAVCLELELGSYVSEGGLRSDCALKPNQLLFSRLLPVSKKNQVK